MVGSVWVLSRVVHFVTRPEPPRPAVTSKRAPPPPPPVRVEPVIMPAPVLTQVGPHLEPAFSAALDEGDLAAMTRTYTSESSLDIALRSAVHGGRKDVVKWVLDRGADPHFEEDDVASPILVADAHPEIVRLFHERGVKDPDLSRAIEAGAPNAVGRILAKDRSAARPKDESMPLVAALDGTVATEESRTRIVEKLLAAGADPNAGDPLFRSVGRCSDAETPEVCLPITRLLAKNATVSPDALVAAVELGESPARTKVLDVLLGGKLAPSATATALTHLSSEGEAPLVKRLVARGVAWSYHDGEPDAAAPLVDAVERQDVTLVRTLLDAGAPADLHYKDGRSALASAIDGSSSQSTEAARIVELLVQHGANVNRRLPDGRSPLFAAAETGDLRVVKTILAAGARVNERILDETALDAAERTGNVPVARVLDGHGARRAPPRPEL